MLRFLAPALLAAQPVASTPPGFYDVLRVADGRLAAIGYRLATANVPLCDRLQPEIGAALHAVEQYRGGDLEGARRAFGFEAPVAVEAVVPDSPAARAGVRADDAVVAVDGAPLTGGGKGTADRDAALDRLEAGPPDRPVALSLRHGGKGREVTVRPVPGCRARFELLLGTGFDAGSDGRVVHLGERFFERFTDEEIAVVVAHELAHAILHHRERLDAAKVNRGLLREVGRNGRLFRETERDADRLAVHLLANAGYDPMGAARFWRERGPLVDHGVFRARTHDSARARAELAEAEARAIAGEPRPVIPAELLATRDRPLS